MLISPVKTNAFATGNALEQRTENVSRGYCDACIKGGVEVFMEKGMDPDVYARSMGVTLAALMAQYPAWRP